MKLDIQLQKLDLVRQGEIVGSASFEDVWVSSQEQSSRVEFYVGVDLRLMPVFNEKDLDTFFFIV